MNDSHLMIWCVEAEHISHTLEKTCSWKATFDAGNQQSGSDRNWKLKVLFFPRIITRNCFPGILIVLGLSPNPCGVFPTCRTRGLAAQARGVDFHGGKLGKLQVVDDDCLLGFSPIDLRNKRSSMGIPIDQPAQLELTECQEFGMICYDWVPISGRIWHGWDF